MLFPLRGMITVQLVETFSDQLVQFMGVKAHCLASQVAIRRQDSIDARTYNQ
jgi:hypothetical protein